MKNQKITSEKELLSSLHKEELVEKLLNSEKELFIYHDLLKQTHLENKKLQQKCMELEKQLSQNIGEGYNNASSWVSKIAFVLKNENRPLRSQELISILERKEPSLKNHHSKAKAFSAYLNSAVKHNRIIQQKINGVRGYYYVLPEWLGDDGLVMSSYKSMML